MSAPSPKAAAVDRVVPAGRWADATPEQRRALAPLAAHWDTLSRPQQRHWLALSNNFVRLSPAEQTTLHGRMLDWIALTPQQRNQARGGFTATRKLPADDKRTQWEAYQALPDVEKRRLASKAVPPPVGAAAATRPAAPGQIAVVPVPGDNPRNPPRIPVAPRALPKAAPTAGASAAPPAPATAPAAQP